MNLSSKIYLAGGCFWGLEQYLGLVRGVEKTLVGYAGGHLESPSYEAVCTGSTGHAETVLAYYDPAILPLEQLLEIFYQAIDPTTLDRQGNDRGSQYRTGIYYTHPEEEAVIKASLARLQNTLTAPVVVECLPFKNFYPAEPHHQKYLDKHPGGYCHITPAQLIKAQNWNPAHKDREALRKSLTPIQFQVTQENATEPPYQNPYWNTFERGIYVDITTGEPLFLSADKFQSDCGWPSFSAPAVPLAEKTDTTHGMVRTEVRSRKGDSHLGHLFPDGPRERGGNRYCINSAALRFIPAEEMEQAGYGAFLPLL